MRHGRRRSRSENAPRSSALKGMFMNRASQLALLLLSVGSVVQAKDLVEVYDDALHNDPVIRQADANRLAARESRPQALSALLPQINGTASVTRDHNSGTADQINAISNPNNPNGPLIPVVI